MVKVVNKGMLDIKHDEFEEWLTNRSDDLLMLASSPKHCPIAWFLIQKGYPVYSVNFDSVSFVRYNIAEQRDIIELRDLPEWASEFIHHLDIEFGKRTVNRDECLKVLAYWKDGLVGKAKE